MGSEGLALFAGRDHLLGRESSQLFLGI